MIPLSLKLKAMIPGYRARYRKFFSVLLNHLEERSDRMTFDCENGLPYIDDGDIRFYGFFSGPKEYQQLHSFGYDFCNQTDPKYFRLAKDYITRFIYPHMRPDLWPDGVNRSNWGGFHGQHKETIKDYINAERVDLERIFKPKQEDVVIDCGCFIGMGDTHLSKTMQGTGKIFAIEADKYCYSLLEKNIETNSLKNVIPLHKGVWDKEIEIALQSSHAQANSLVQEVHTGEETYQVLTTTIDSVISEYDVKKLDMISMTINGAEVEALKGADTTLKQLRPRLRLAGWYHRDGKPIWYHAESFLTAYDYKVFHTPRGNVLAVPGESI